MAKKFGALAEFRQAQSNAPEPSAETTSVQAETSTAPEPGKGRGRPTGKRSNPDFEPTTVLLRKQTKRKASRLLEDTDSAYDFSELIETLLGQWISKHS